MSDRSTQLNAWLEQLGYRDFKLSAASADASFRSYLRLQTDAESRIVMDAPPQHEPCDQFIAVASSLRKAGLSAPEIIASDLDRGFLILTDFGAEDYLSQLNADSEAGLYGDALAALLVMQTRIDATGLPDYDAAMLRREMDLFHDWFIGDMLALTLDDRQQKLWRHSMQILIDNALAQPQVFVHRDYHSRNLMKLPDANPGILDFQDAVKGPLTYDLVSLLRDCYIDWPVIRVEQLALDYYAQAREQELFDVEPEVFLRWFNLMGVQRHLKAIGIFSRLKIRDGKSGYLKDIPRTLSYLQQVCAGDLAMMGLLSLIDQLELEARADALLAG